MNVISLHSNHFEKLHSSTLLHLLIFPKKKIVHMIHSRNIEHMKLVKYHWSILVSKLLFFTFPTRLMSFQISTISVTFFSDIIKQDAARKAYMSASSSKGEHNTCCRDSKSPSQFIL